MRSCTAFHPRSDLASRRLRRSACEVPAALLLGFLIGTASEPLGANQPQAEEPRPPYFSEVAQEIGADFRHQAGRRGDYAIAEINGAGCALIDVDNDGDLDLFLVQGGATQTSANGELVPSDAVLLNNLIGSQGKSQDLQFSPAPGNAGVVESGYGFGAATGDFDNDGRTDLLVTNLGPNRLWRNRGDGTFEDVTVAAGLQQDRWSVSASFIDFDSDGWLDLYVGNYLTLAPGENKLCRTTAGAPDYCGPSAYPGAGDQVWRNRGDGTFEDVSLATGIGRPRGRSLGVVSGDFNQDGRPDLLVANDQESNFLWLNQDGTTFLDEAVLAGVAVNREGRVEASMGADAADMDNDGDEDLFLTHLVTETNTLYLNEGAGMFEDATARLGLGVPSLRSTSWGTRAFDFDNDGRLDLFSANGAVRVIESLAAEGDPNPFHEPNQLFRNLGAAGFEDDSANGGPGFELSEVSRGAAFGDLDNDGDTDIVVTQNDGPVRILINNVGQERPWLGLRVVGRATRQATSRPRDMYGAWVVLEQAGRPTQWRRVRTDGSFASASDPRILFGLGVSRPPLAKTRLSVTVLWPDGRKERFENLKPGRYTTVTKGKGSLLP